MATRGALEVLTEEQLRAVLEHERAHIAGRHHMVKVLVDAFSRAFRGLPLARQAKEQTNLLLEMIADDHALRSTLHRCWPLRCARSPLGGRRMRCGRIRGPHPFPARPRSAATTASCGLAEHRGGRRRHSAGGVRALTRASRSGPALFRCAH
ncbi:M48 family metalloprotease [Streptomyces iakyrus]|uniref:M48 family metalloprotease n=1 Tax=Streptomyces iakyrus TaxID=68219 RepID=UPI0033B3A801